MHVCVQGLLVHTAYSILHIDYNIRKAKSMGIH